jgi:hypothetical protein
MTLLTGKARWRGTYKPIKERLMDEHRIQQQDDQGHH